MASYRIISSDDHVFEPPELWTSRIEPRYKDRCPQIVRVEDGTDWWFCDGHQGMGTGPGGQAGVRFEHPEKLSMADTLENVRPGGYDPDEHLKDMDIDGIDVSLMYPTAGLSLFRVPDGELLSAVFRTYNTWLAEFCNAYPKRQKGIAMVNLDDIQEGVEELERCANMGLIGAMISIYPPPDRGYHLPEYEPLWSAAEDLEMPLSLHIGTNRPADGGIKLMGDMPGPEHITQSDYWVRMSLSQMIFYGVFERHPKLQVGSIEQDLAWVPHFLSRLHYNYTQRTPGKNWYRYKEDMLPGDYFHRNVFLSFQDDDYGIRFRDIIGVDSLLWGSDYPHAESTFPKSQEIIEETLASCTTEEKAKIVGGNAARIYRVD